MTNMNIITIHQDWIDFKNVLYVDYKGRYSVEYYYYDNETAIIRNLYVDENNRRKGYGNMILDIVEKDIKKKLFKDIQLLVEKDSFMNEWYLRRGYVFNTVYESTIDKRNLIWLRKVFA